MSDPGSRDGESLSPTIAGQIELVCDRFESAWRGGARPRIEDYWQEADGSDLLRELLVLELAYRVRFLEHPSPADYRPRFAAHSEVIRSAFEAVPARRPSPGPPAPAPPRSGADINLLFGLLALQNGLIDQGQLVAAFQAWTLDQSRSLADHLQARGDLDLDDRRVVEALVARHLKKHGGDPEKSLAALAVGPSTRESLARVAEPVLQGSIARVGSGSAENGDTDPIVPYAVGTATSNGQRFRVLRPHARGGLGAVYVALDRELHREVALKQMLDHHADDPESRRRFLIEAEITGGLEHPGIVPVYGLGTYGDGRPYYAMRFVRGDSLKEAIEQFHANEGLKADPGYRSLELRKLLRRFTDVCNTIEYAHSRGVLHRDIKPGNIMVGKYGETLVVDWGLAKPLGQVEPGQEGGERTLVPSSSSGYAETLPGSALGTPAYMSPEQASGELDQLGSRSDVYSLGATLYCLLTGRTPSPGDDISDVLRKVRRGEFSRPRQLDPSLDPSLEAVCLKAMAVNPQDRYATCRALADDIERWIADEPVSARREPASARLARWARRHRTAVAAMGLSLATAVILLTVSNVLVRTAQRETARALSRVEEEQGRTVKALQRADANYRRARQAVEDYFTTISEDTLLDEPGMQPLRQKLLGTALEYHRVFLEERANDQGIEAELALSHRRYGNIVSLIGRHDEVLAHYQSALEGFEELARQHPDRPEYKRQLAMTLADFGNLYPGQSGGRDEAIRASRRAIILFEELLRQRPDDPSVREGLAVALSHLGQALSLQRDGSDEAGRHLWRARDILQKLVADSPDSLPYRYKLAELHYKLYGMHAGHADRQVEALQSSQDAIDVYKALLERAPNSPRYQHRIGLLHSVRGIYFARMGRFEDGIREEEQARRVLLDVVRDNPGVEQYRKDLASSCLKLGAHLLSSGAPEQALRLLTEAREAFERVPTKSLNSFDIAGYLATVSYLGEITARLGRYDEASAALGRAAELFAESCRRDPTNIFLRGGRMDNTFQFSRVLTRLDRHADAIAAYEEAKSIAAEVFPGGDWSHGDHDGFQVTQLAMAYSLRELGKVDEAERVVARVRGSIGNRPLPLVELARFDARGAARLALAGGDSDAVRVLEDQAMDDLRRAVNEGFSESPPLKQDHCFDRLRSRDDFRLLLLDLAFPKDPFARGR
jgi:serine/threonine-protein kinase